MLNASSCLYWDWDCSDKTLELAQRLDVYNKLLQTRLYGSVGMDDLEEEDIEEVEEVEEEEG